MLKKYLKLFLIFFKISSFTIGGGGAMLPLVMDEVTVKRDWMTETEIIDCIAVAQSIPGAMIGNVSVYVGRKVAGFAGAVLACLGTALPAFISILIIMLFWNRIDSLPVVMGFFKAALAAAAGLITVSAFRLGKIAIKHTIDVFLFIVSFILVAFLHINVVFVLLGGAALGFPYYAYRARKMVKGMK